MIKNGNATTADRQAKALWEDSHRAQAPAVKTKKAMKLSHIKRSVSIFCIPENGKHYTDTLSQHLGRKRPVTVA